MNLLTSVSEDSSHRASLEFLIKTSGFCFSCCWGCLMSKVVYMALRSELQSMPSAACGCNWGIITDLARATWYRWGRMDTCLVTRMFELPADVQGRNYNYCCPRQKKVRAARWRLVIQCWLMRCDSESDSTVITEQVCFLHNKSFTLISSELLLSPNTLKNVFFFNQQRKGRSHSENYIISFCIWRMTFWTMH